MATAGPTARSSTSCRAPSNECIRHLRDHGGRAVSRIIINALGEKFGPIDVLLEEPESRLAFLKRRARKIGWFTTAGQFATMVLVRLGKKRHAARIDAIVAEDALEPEPKPQHKIIEIGSVNSQACLEAIRRLDPKVVLLAGCRIMKPDILRSIPARS